MSCKCRGGIGGFPLIGGLVLLALAFLASPAYADGTYTVCSDGWGGKLCVPIVVAESSGPGVDTTDWLLEARAEARSGYHDDWCEDVRSCVKARPCIESDWRWYAARNRSCEPADESTQRAFLCYLDGLGQPQRWKLLRWLPVAEAAYEAELRNKAQCR